MADATCVKNDQPPHQHTLIRVLSVFFMECRGIYCIFMRPGWELICLNFDHFYCLFLDENVCFMYSLRPVLTSIYTYVS